MYFYQKWKMIVGPFSANSSLEEAQEGEDVSVEYFHNIKLKFASPVQSAVTNK